MSSVTLARLIADEFGFAVTGRGVCTRAIAEKLGVSVKTVEAHRENIKGKLGLANHAALVARAAQWLRESGQG